MQIVEKIETIVKFSETSGKDILILSGIGFTICCFFTLIQRIIQNTSQTSMEIWITGLLTGVIIAIIGIYKPTILDSFLPNEPKTHYETNVDKSKYELSVITNNNEKYLKFDNKGNENIQIRNNNKKVNSDIFKIVAENDNEYLLEYEVVDKGFFSDTVKQERSSLKK
jgi:hypothetical protein